MGASRQEIAADLREKITQGSPGYAPGETLPSAADLAPHYGVSKTVVQQAYQDLEQEGLVDVRRRRGTIVRDYQRRRLTRSRQVHRDEYGYSFDAPSIPWRLLEHYGVQRLTAPPHVAELLRLAAPAPVVVVRDRLLGVPRAPGQRKPEPMQLATTYIPLWLVDQLPILEQPDTGPGGILDRIEEATRHPLTWSEDILADSASRAESERLAVPAGAAVLRFATVSYLSDGRPAELTVRTMDGAKFRAGPVPVTRHRSATWPPSPATLPASTPTERE